MSIIFYGIPNCDTVKKARVWLDGKGIAYAFHDYKKAGADAPIATMEPAQPRKSTNRIVLA